MAFTTQRESPHDLDTRKVEQIAKDVSERARQIAHDAGHKASEYYDEAREWVGENYGKVLAVAGIAAAAGLVGWFMIRRSREFSEEFPEMSGRRTRKSA